MFDIWFIKKSITLGYMNETLEISTKQEFP